MDLANMPQLIFWLSLFSVYYVYHGYRLFLELALFFMKKKDLAEETSGSAVPSVTVLVTVHNEEKGIGEKIDNILEQGYPEQQLEILVASDGSTDATDSIVESRARNVSNVRLFRPANRKGKTDTQNQAIGHARGSIIIFTDCDTLFSKDFLVNLVHAFVRQDVGCATGRLFFLGEQENSISTSQGYYWNYETRLRELESELGVLAVASGACMAVRKELFRPMEAAYGEDCILPLDVVLQGYKVVHVPDAIAYDRMPSTVSGEFRARVRMTLRNWQGTWARAELLNPFHYPAYSWALWSHKILRWLSPYLLVALALSTAMLASRSPIFQAVYYGLWSLFFAGIIGYVVQRWKIQVPLVGAIYSFLLANAGFFFGTIQAALGRKITKYN